MAPCPIPTLGELVMGWPVDGLFKDRPNQSMRFVIGGKGLAMTKQAPPLAQRTDQNRAMARILAVARGRCSRIMVSTPTLSAASR
jgi:hypothetical protein